eukprot:TRINITY_DN1871_c7_g1_i1.p1 TRINITY_DN1871_c7_g1~~TRINITY_DN1871_c7_g1_i1.p1  ORF type:complete len:672 (+),score=145.71 TRINITY_DN1871_c7_g1_i1:65-2017(+)
MRWANAPDGASPVIMVRSLPPRTTEEDLTSWSEKYCYNKDGVMLGAKCVKALVLHDRMMGFVQLSDIDAARAIMAQFVYNPPSIYIEKGGEKHALNLVYSDKQEIKASNKGRSAPQPKPVYTNSRLLLVVLKELSQIVTIDELFLVFSQIAKIEKISSFQKDRKNQVVFQFETSQGADAAMNYFNGKHLPSKDSTTPLCFLAIVPSKLEQLTFRNQDSKNRDYTMVNNYIQWFLESQAGNTDKPTVQNAWTMLCMECRMTANILYDFIWGQKRWGAGWLFPAQEPKDLGRIPETTMVTATEGKVGQCMHISGLPVGKEEMGADQVWKLCGMYGEVRAVKMLYHFKGCVVVQYSTVEACNQAIHHLNGLEYKGRTWDAKKSRQPNAVHWNGASDDLQKRMVSSGDRLAPPRCELSTAFPAKEIVIWDVPKTVTASQCQHLIVTTSCVTPQSVTVDESEHQITVQFATLDDSVQTICSLNGHQEGGWKLQLRFASNQPNQSNGFFRRASQEEDSVGHSHTSLTFENTANSTVADADDDIVEKTAAVEVEEEPVVPEPAAVEEKPLTFYAKKKNRKNVPMGIPRPPPSPSAHSVKTEGTPQVSPASISYTVPKTCHIRTAHEESPWAEIDTPIKSEGDAQEINGYEQRMYELA